jgi:hypothetical protein
MKNFIKSILVISLLAFTVASCDKANDLPYYDSGSAATLTSSVSTIAPAPADSNSVALKLSWTDPKHAQDSSLYKYVVEIDSSGRNFKNEVTKTVVGIRNTTFTAKELNNILLGFGFAFNTPYDIDVRVTSSYGNNNEQIKSNTIKLKATPYKVPPKIALPASGKLFLVGDASQGGWNNPVPVPTQQFGMTDETTFVGVFNLIGGKNYLVLPVNGDWSHKYSIADGSVPAAGGDFGYDLPTNFNGPATSGWYKIILDFQHGKFIVQPYTGPNLPDNLFMVGDATPGGWNNPVPVPAQQLTRLNSIQFQLPSLAITAGKNFLLLPVNGDWTNKYAVSDNSIAGLAAGGFFGYNLAQNFPGPAVAGNYKFDINFGIAKGTDANTAWFQATKL